MPTSYVSHHDYLNEIIALYVNGRTPKQLIDEQLTAEIKVLLDDPHLSVTEIAQHFKLPRSVILKSLFQEKYRNVTQRI